MHGFAALVFIQFYILETEANRLLLEEAQHVRVLRLLALTAHCGLLFLLGVDHKRRLLVILANHFTVKYKLDFSQVLCNSVLHNAIVMRQTSHVPWFLHLSRRFTIIIEWALLFAPDVNGFELLQIIGNSVIVIFAWLLVKHHHFIIY
jgi:hypothetical protein